MSDENLQEREILCPIPLCSRYIKRKGKGLLKHIIEKGFDIGEPYCAEWKIRQNHKWCIDKLNLSFDTKMNDKEIESIIKSLNNFPFMIF